MKKVMVFGVFDGLHKGHEHFLREARGHGDYLVVVLAPDNIVRTLKGREPNHNLAERMEHLKALDAADEVVAGDPELSGWEVIKKYRPDIIALGYDQDALKEDLRRHLHEFDWPVEIMIMSPHEPEKYHSSLIK